MHVLGMVQKIKLRRSAEGVKGDRADAEAI